MNKTGICLVAFLFTLLSCNSGEKQRGVPDNALDPDIIQNPATASSAPDKNTKVPELKFEEENHDFGTVTEGEKVSYSFRFKNTGEGELVIRSASGSCGCTVPEWPKDPIPPGKDGVIKVTFDSEGRAGMIHKSVTIVANTVPNTKVITISGEVVKPGQED